MRRLARILRGRLGAVVGIVLLILGWNAFVAMNDDGILSGAVVGADGRPASGSIVTLQRRDVLSTVDVGTKRTDAHGRFTFRDHGGYDLIVTATGPDGKEARRRVRLLFRDRNHVLEEPLVLNGAT